MKIGRFTPILSIAIILSCFYLLISHFKHFSTWISRLPFAVNVMLNRDLRVRSFGMIRISISDPRSLGSWTRIHWFIWSTMVWVISDQWSILIRIISKEFITVRSRFGHFTTNDINCGLRLTVSRYPFGHIWDLRFVGGEWLTNMAVASYPLSSILAEILSSKFSFFFK